MALQSRTSANLEEIDDFSIKGIALPMTSKGAKTLKLTMPLSRDIISFP